MLTVYPKELSNKITYKDGVLVATCELTDEEQKMLDDLIEQEKKAEEERFNID